MRRPTVTNARSTTVCYLHQWLSEYLFLIWYCLLIIPTCFYQVEPYPILHIPYPNLYYTYPILPYPTLTYPYSTLPIPYFIVDYLPFPTTTISHHTLPYHTYSNPACQKSGCQNNDDIPSKTLILLFLLRPPLLMSSSLLAISIFTLIILMNLKSSNS